MFFYRLDKRNTTVESILHFQSAKTDLACHLFLLEILDSSSFDNFGCQQVYLYLQQTIQIHISERIQTATTNN